jgi:hypothetical protein
VDAQVMGEEERDEGEAEGEAEDGRELGEEEDDEVPAPVDDGCRGREVSAQARSSRLRVPIPRVEGTKDRIRSLNCPAPRAIALIRLRVVGGDGIEPPTSSMSS